ncbi:uncharacterized protein EI90DRAFT_349441 [Cantharellus anzutake]|uniref:uncharacterized protein n=1 Tax=Cantharellus anzutake TaxID=1750568 RepID=UPI001906D017|nr:uncharacterized protein EI90DRAFT_349441 [Cantharellus anzutake]KAF8315269.1 hypothetical protein EI90DRAFT_349441 [Cantharellus anzutake]
MLHETASSRIQLYTSQYCRPTPSKHCILNTSPRSRNFRIACLLCFASKKYVYQYILFHLYLDKDPSSFCFSVCSLCNHGITRLRTFGIKGAKGTFLRGFLSYLQSSLGDTTAFYLPSTLGLYEYVGNIDQSSVLDFGSLPYPAASSSASEFIPHSSASLLQQVIPVQEGVSCGENWDFLMLDITVNYELAGPSTALRSQSDASPHETRGETLKNAASWNEDAVSCLRSLAWSMGYCLIPRGAAIPGGGALV